MNEYYSDIPARLLQDKRILEVGSGYGRNQMLSIHRDLFRAASDRGDYVGYDRLVSVDPLLNIIEADIRTVDLQGQYDVILIMHCLEHIMIHDWDWVLYRLKRVLISGGWIVVAGPYMEPNRDVPNRRRDPNHVVFDIDEEFLDRYLSGVRMFRANIKYPRVWKIRNFIWWWRCLFRGDGWIPFKLLKMSFIAFWRKESKAE